MTDQRPEVLALKSLAGLYGDRPHDAGPLLDETGLSVDDFTEKATQALFVGLAEMIRAGRPLEVLGLMHAASRSAKRELVLDVVSGDNPDFAPERVRILREATRRRRMLEALNGLRELVAKPGDIEAALGEVERVLRQLSSTSTKNVGSLDGSLMRLVDKLEEVQSGKRESTLQTGIDALDYAIGGLQPTLTMVGALPGVGKSALFSAIARNLASRGLKVGVLSLEDEREWLAERLLAEAAGVPLFVLGNRPLTTGQMSRVTDCSSQVYSMLQNIIVDDSLAMSPAEVVASARSMVARGCRAVLVDHLGEIRLNRSERHDLDVLEALQDLRGIAKAYRVPVWVACHLRRREGLNTDSAPRLTDFAFSAAIERCARVALGLFQPKGEKGKPPELGVEVMKQTKGPKDFNFRLNMGAMSGTVLATPVSQAMRHEFGGWRDES